MYPKKRLLNRGSARGSYNPFCSEIRIARPFSYYVKGGVDLDGISTRPPLPSHFDDADGISSGEVDMATDPRIGRMDIVDYASERYSESERRAAADIANTD